MKPLSPTNRLNALIFPAMLFVGLTLFLILNEKALSLTVDILFFVLYATSVGWIYAALRRTFDLYYDSTFLYLKKLNSERRIPLTEIRRIYLTGDSVKIMGMNSWKYNIEFEPLLSVDEQSIWEIMGSKKVDEFVDVVRKVKPNLIVKIFILMTK